MLLTLEKLKAQLGGVQAKLNFDTVLPFVRVAERDFRRTVGPELYDYLAGLESAEGDEAELAELAHGCIAWAAYDMALPHLKQRVGDLGITKVSPANTVAITKWEYLDMRDSNMAMVDLCWESFWQLLGELDPEVWKSSPARKRYNQYFIRTADELYRYIALAGRNRRFFDTLTEYIRRAEQLYIEDVLTETVFEDLKDKWQDPDANLTPLETKLIEKIRHALAPLAIYEAYPYLPIKVDESGLREIRRKDGTQEEEIADKPYRQAQRRQLFQDGQLFLAKLRGFLDKNATETTFAGYYALNLVADDYSEDFEDFTNKAHIIL
ncbi:DUF6712 family protein [Salmonirosea aquatica]|uniref:Uncharacterized protein n=1 Tax=Salmonirosea aquatica TaxID=2654236 RepID=A0A7C9BDU9_9BACT|nr:hypothetical protein [Cytophagaceae bacterium SJW1-29]